MSVDLSFDSDTPNVCGPGEGGVYLVGAFSGNRNSAILHFLGYDYVSSGGIESGAFGPCGHSAPIANLRLFVGSGVQADQNGTPVEFVGLPGFGNFYIGLPAPSQLDGLPVQLPTDPFPTRVEHFGDANQLLFRSAEIRAVPEPGTLVLLLTGISLTRFRQSKAPKAATR